MLKTYFSSVLIYAVVIYASTNLLIKFVAENGWLEGAKKPRDNGIPIIARLFLMSAVPVLRFAVVAALFYMAMKKKDEAK